MSERKDGISAKDLENTIRKVKDVLASKVVLDESGQVEEIHVLAGPGRSVRYIARDVESSIMAAFGMEIDRRKISIAQVDSEEPLKPEKRVRLTQVTLVTGTDEAVVKVHLSVGDTEVVGTASGLPTPANWLRLAAEATISAICQFIEAGVQITVDDVIITSSRSTKIALVSVLVMSSDGEEKVLSGSCPIVYDEREAVVKATLDALNRRFAVLLNQRKESGISFG